jgi:copper chaperone CopZ
MKTTLLYLQGMHCPSCKLLVEKSLIELPNIQAVDANVRKGQVWLQYEGKLPLPEIITLIHELGYQVIEKPLSTPRITKQKNNYIIALISLIIFLVLYVILKKTGLFNGTITSTSSPSW